MFPSFVLFTRDRTGQDRTGQDRTGHLSIRTKDGKIFEDAELKKVDSEFVLIKHSGGVARVSLIDLPKTERRKLNIKPSLSLLKFDLNLVLAEAKVPLAILKEQYQNHLQEAMSEAQKTGNLGNLLLIKKELQAFPSGEKLDYKDFPKLGEMRGIYDTQLSKRKKEGIANLRASYAEYLKELEIIEVTYTQSGNVEKAVEASKEASRMREYLSDEKELETAAGELLIGEKQMSSGEVSPGEVGDYYLVIASMSSDAIYSANLKSGEVKTLYQFAPKTAPRGITADQNSLYVGLRFGSMNVIKLTPDAGSESGFKREDISERIGVHGTGHLLFTESGDLIVAGATGGAILQYDLKTNKPIASLQPIGMKNVIGIDAGGGYVYGVEVFDGKISKTALSQKQAEGKWLMDEPDGHLQRSAGIAVGHNGNLFVSNVKSSLIPEFSSETGEYIGDFFDLSKEGEAMAKSLVYEPALKNYVVMAGGSILIIDTAGKLVKKIAVPPEVNADGIVLIRKSGVSKILGNKL